MLYWRQRVVLALLEKVPRNRASKIQLIKWLFLLKEEEGLGRYGAFYDFVPYKHGPFSFVAYRDVAALERNGWITSTKASFQLSTHVPQSAASTLQREILNSIARVIRSYGHLQQHRLTEYVYREYPWYASRSESNDVSPPHRRKSRASGLFSIGYEGLSIDAFLNAILKRKLTSLVDVRNNAASRKYGFSRSSLENKCDSVGVRYHHYPELGIPARIRNADRKRAILWSIYRREILKEAAPVLDDVAKLCRAEPCALLCFEREPKDCHRTLVAREIHKRTGLPIYQYQSAKETWAKK